jgi:phosphatidylinositol phospholipase C, delta
MQSPTYAGLITLNDSVSGTATPQEQSRVKAVFSTALTRSKSLLSRSPSQSGASPGRKPRALSDSLKTRPSMDFNPDQASSSGYSPSTDLLSSHLATPPTRPGPTGVFADSVDVTVPYPLRVGIPMTKISTKSQKDYTFQLDAEQGQILWVSKKLRISK